MNLEQGNSDSMMSVHLAISMEEMAWEALMQLHVGSAALDDWLSVNLEPRLASVPPHIWGGSGRYPKMCGLLYTLGRVDSCAS